jgi:hypothetical protein
MSQILAPRGLCKSPINMTPIDASVTKKKKGGGLAKPGGGRFALLASRPFRRGGRFLKTGPERERDKAGEIGSPPLA